MSKSKKKKETQKEAISSFAEAIRKLRKNVRKELDKNKKPAAESKSKPKPKKKVPDTKRTKDVKRQLRKSLSKADIKKLQDKKKNNPGKKRGGY